MIKKKKEKKYLECTIDIQSTPTDTVTTTSGQAIADVFGENSEFMEIIKEREKISGKHYCPRCRGWYSSTEDECPTCSSESE